MRDVPDDLLEQHGAGGLRIRLAADPASVPGARRFVTDGLRSLGLVALVDDAALCVTELTANAALHSASSFMEVTLDALEQSVRIVVEDDGDVPVEAVVPRATFGAVADDVERAIADETTTGRGLGIVSVLAYDWGVEDTGAGKRVWLTLVDDDVIHPVRPPRAAAGEPVRDLDAALPEGWALVRLAGCPVALSLRQDQHLDELIREFQLIAGDQDNPRSRELAQQLEGLLSTPAHARHTGRRIAQQAAAEGKTHIDVDMAMPRELGAQVVALQEAVREADRLCDEMRLLTLASTAELRDLRAWMTEEVSGQLEHAAVPVRWDDWLAARDG